MKSTFKFIQIAAVMAIAIIFTACSKNSDPTPDPTPDPPGPAGQTVFSSASETIYRGDANANQLGLYTLTLEANGQKLYLEFSSSLSTSAIPVPDAGKYNFSTENGLSKFNDKSYWLSSANGTEITRRFESGSFTFTVTSKGYKIEGQLTSRDKTTLDFVYEGALKFVDFNGNPVEGAIKCLSARGTYYGFYYIPNAADYYIVLFDTLHQKEGDPYSYRICLDFNSVRPAGGSLMPALGTYRVDKDGFFAEGTFVAGMFNGANGTLWQIPDGQGGATRFMVQNGFFTIRTTDNGKYQIFGTLKDMYSKEISFDYTGELPFVNDAAGTFTSLTTDFAMGEAYYANQKCYDNSAAEVDMWKIYFYDEEGWTSKGKAGYFITFDIPLAKGAKSIPAGEYTPAAHVLLPEAGNYIPGYVFALGTSMEEAYGSWLAKGKGDYSGIWAPIRGGTLKLVENADKTFTATFDVLDDDYIPKHITGQFTGAIPVLEVAQPSALAIPASSHRER